MTTLNVYVNCDSSDSEYGTSGVDWVLHAEGSDKLIFSAGSATVADGESIPSEQDLIQAGTLVSTTVAVEVQKCFLQDTSDAILKEIHNAGNQNKRYTFAFSFSGATASEPVLEIWDDSDLDSTDLVCLGEGTPANSWFLGICTTSGLPGADWFAGGSQINMAGSADSHFIYLNDENGALAGADVLYCQLGIKIPANPDDSASAQPVYVCKYTSN